MFCLVSCTIHTLHQTLPSCYNKTKLTSLQTFFHPSVETFRVARTFYPYPPKSPIRIHSITRYTYFFFFFFVFFYLKSTSLRCDSTLCDGCSASPPRSRYGRRMSHLQNREAGMHPAQIRHTSPPQRKEAAEKLASSREGVCECGTQTQQAQPSQQLGLLSERTRTSAPPVSSHRQQEDTAGFPSVTSASIHCLGRDHVLLQGLPNQLPSTQAQD